MVSISLETVLNAIRSTMAAMILDMLDLEGGPIELQFVYAEVVIIAMRSLDLAGIAHDDREQRGRFADAVRELADSALIALARAGKVEVTEGKVFPL